MSWHSRRQSDTISSGAKKLEAASPDGRAGGQRCKDRVPIAGLAVAAVLVMVMRIEALEGERSAELPSTAGFDPDDAMVLVPFFIWLGFENLLLGLAALGAPVFCAVLAMTFRRRLWVGD